MTYLYEGTPRAAQVCNGVVILIAHNDEASIAGSELLYDALHLGMHSVPGGNDDDGHVLIHQCQGPMLHFPSQNAFAVHQRHFFHLHHNRCLRIQAGDKAFRLKADHALRETAMPCFTHALDPDQMLESS